MPGKMTEEKALEEEKKIQDEHDIVSAIVAYAKENKGRKINKDDFISETIQVPYTMVIDEDGNPYARYDRDEPEGFFAGQGAMGQAEYAFDLKNKKRVIMKTQNLTKEVVNDPDKCPDFVTKWADFCAESDDNSDEMKEKLLTQYIEKKNEEIGQEIELSKDVGLSLGKCVISKGEDGFEVFEFQKPSGISLSKASNELNLSMEDKLDIMISAFENLQLIHKKGIWHGDIQPGNILVMKDPETGKFKATIIDFGEAIRSAPDIVQTDNRPADLKQFAFEFENFFDGRIKIKRLTEEMNALGRENREGPNGKSIQEQIASIRKNVEKDKSDPKYKYVNAIIQPIKKCGHSSLSEDATTALHNMRVMRATEDVLMAMDAVKKKDPSQTSDQLKELKQKLEKATEVLHGLNEAERKRVLEKDIAKTPEISKPVKGTSLIQRIMSSINLKRQTQELTEQPSSRSFVSRSFVREKGGEKLVDLVDSGKRKNSGPDPAPDPKRPKSYKST